MAKAKTNEAKEESLEKHLWKTADKLRKNIDAAEYKHVALGLIFLKYISDAFDIHFAKLKAGEGEYAGADPEDKDEYKAENIFFVPAEARWSFLVAKAKQPQIGSFVDNAMDAIEKENPSLKGVLPKVYARQNLDPASLGELIDLIGNISTDYAQSHTSDLLGHVFEYFWGEFALAEGKQGGQFYTPRSSDDIKLISKTYHAWRTGEDPYEDDKGFCASVSLERVAELDYVLTPGRYVGQPDEEDDFNFAERFAALKAEFEAQLLEEAALNQAILENLAKIQV